MKICFLSDYQSIHTYRWVKYFAPKHEINLISLVPIQDEAGAPRQDDYEKIGIRLHVIPRKGVNKLLAASRVRKMLQAINPDIVHAHYITHYGYLGATSRFHPLVMTAWGSDVLVEVHSSIIKRYQVNYALKRTDAVTCDGENTAKALKEIMGNDSKIKKIYFGVDTQKINPGRRVEDFFNKYRKDGKGKIIINVRGFNDVYDPGTFIKAIPPVLKSFPDTIFLIAREGEKRKIYEEMASSIGIGNSVKFIGNIPADDLPVYLASADIYVSNSLSDSGISASTAEAMASGMAVISTDVGDISHWIENGKNGLIIPKGDYNAISEKIRYLLANDEKRRSMGKQARITIETRQDYYKEMNKVEQLYESLVREAKK